MKVLEGTFNNEGPGQFSLALVLRDLFCDCDIFAKVCCQLYYLPCDCLCPRRLGTSGRTRAPMSRRWPGSSSCWRPGPAASLADRQRDTEKPVTRRSGRSGHSAAQCSALPTTGAHLQTWHDALPAPAQPSPATSRHVDLWHWLLLAPVAHFYWTEMS